MIKNSVTIIQFNNCEIQKTFTFNIQPIIIEGFNVAIPNGVTTPFLSDKKIIKNSILINQSPESNLSTF